MLINKLMYYTYLLIDPRTNKPFYVGKGKNNRDTSHIRGSDGCNNQEKDRVINEIKSAGLEVIVKKEITGINDEEEAYTLEEQLIEKIGLENLTNKYVRRKPPSQLNKKRSELTIQKIKENSKSQGLQRTIEHVIRNKELIYAVLQSIKDNKRRATVCAQTPQLTIDLYNKIKKKCAIYISILNEHTDLYIEPFALTKTNGMIQKLFNDYKDTLIEMYKLKNQNEYTRQEIANKLNITLDFYDRHKNKESEFIRFIDTK